MTAMEGDRVEVDGYLGAEAAKYQGVPLEEEVASLRALKAEVGEVSLFHQEAMLKDWVDAWEGGQPREQAHWLSYQARRKFRYADEGERLTAREGRRLWRTYRRDLEGRRKGHLTAPWKNPKGPPYSKELEVEWRLYSWWKEGKRKRKVATEAGWVVERLGADAVVEDAEWEAWKVLEAKRDAFAFRREVRKGRDWEAWWRVVGETRPIDERESRRTRHLERKRRPEGALLLRAEVEWSDGWRGRWVRQKRSRRLGVYPKRRKRNLRQREVLQTRLWRQDDPSELDRRRKARERRSRWKAADGEYELVLETRKKVERCRRERIHWLEKAGGLLERRQGVGDQVGVGERPASVREVDAGLDPEAVRAAADARSHYGRWKAQRKEARRRLRRRAGRALPKVRGVQREGA